MDYFLPSFSQYPQMTDAIIYTDRRGDKFRDRRSFLTSSNFWDVTSNFRVLCVATEKLSFEQRRSLRSCANVSIDQRICLLATHRWKRVYRTRRVGRKGLSHHHILSYDLERRRRYVYLVESKIGYFRCISLQLRLTAEHFPLCDSRSAKLESNFQLITISLYCN